MRGCWACPVCVVLVCMCVCAMNCVCACVCACVRAVRLCESVRAFVRACVCVCVCCMMEMCVCICVCSVHGRDAAKSSVVAISDPPPATMVIPQLECASFAAPIECVICEGHNDGDRCDTTLIARYAGCCARVRSWLRAESSGGLHTCMLKGVAFHCARLECLSEQEDWQRAHQQMTATIRHPRIPISVSSHAVRICLV